MIQRLLYCILLLLTIMLLPVVFFIVMCEYVIYNTTVFFKRIEKYIFKTNEK